MYAAVRDITNVHPLRDEVAKAGVKDKVRIIEIDESQISNQMDASMSVVLQGFVPLSDEYVPTLSVLLLGQS